MARLRVVDGYALPSRRISLNMYGRPSVSIHSRDFGKFDLQRTRQIEAVLGAQGVGLAILPDWLLVGSPAHSTTTSFGVCLQIQKDQMVLLISCNVHGLRFGGCPSH
jgi:hypothetical protein